MIRRALAVLCLLAGTSPAQAPSGLPRWRGFNLQGQFTLQDRQPFAEEDFRLISQWGFNFVRIPLDYRIWTDRNDWRRIDESGFREVDAAVELGRRYGLHVSLNFHRAPGYCVNPPREPRDLWTDPEAAEVFALHWAAFARRYKGVPGDRLSFDLLNEPAGVDGPHYAAALNGAILAIRREDAQRLILVEGLRWGNDPVPEFLPQNVLFSTRGYAPLGVSHYGAPWIPGADQMPAPAWPMRRGLPNRLYGPVQPALHGPLILKGQFVEATELALRVDVVSQKTRLVIRADDQVILDRTFEPGPGSGEWKRAQWVEEYKIWQNLYDKDYRATIPAGTRRLALEAAEGDWLTFSSITLGQAALMPSDREWGRKPSEFTLGPGFALDLASAPILYDRSTLWKEQITPWKSLEARGGRIHVGEWGVYNRTPHAVALAWMEDCLKNWKEAGWGWALWEFRGGFGVLDSNRPDVAYEVQGGHRLDRKMLELLRAY